MKYTLEKYCKDYDALCEERYHMSFEDFDEKRGELYKRLTQDLEVGDGVTYNMYSDRHACTVIKRTKCTLTIQEDKATRIDDRGMSDAQEYTYEQNPKGKIHVARWSNKRNTFIVDGKGISVGRHEYFDYSF